MKKLVLALAAVVSLGLFASAAKADHYYRSYRPHHHDCRPAGPVYATYYQPVVPVYRDFCDRPVVRYRAPCERPVVRYRAPCDAPRFGVGFSSPGFSVYYGR